MDKLHFLDKSYIYYSKCHQLINEELEPLFLRYKNQFRIKNNSFKTFHISKEFIQKKVGNISNIIFEVTQKCNLSCLYCTYNDNYQFSRRNSTKEMNLETAIQAFDLIKEEINYKKHKEVAISFYGGEPFLNWKLIEAIVNHSYKVFDKWKITFNITTNATVLNQKIINFLIRHNFLLMVSLDGPQKINDAKRIYHNGKGSFTDIEHTLKCIKKTNENYYYKKVMISSVHSKDLDFNDVLHYFTTEELVNKNLMKFGFVNELDTDYYKRYPFNYEKKNKSTRKTFLSIINKLENRKELSPIEEVILNDATSIEKELRRVRNPLLGGTCIFDSRVFIDVDGNFHVCEKINNNFSIGNIRTGFDYDYMKELFVEYLKLCEQCLKCEVRFFCTRCLVHMAKDGVLQMDKNFCKLKKHNFKINIKNFLKFKTIIKNEKRI